MGGSWYPPILYYGVNLNLTESEIKELISKKIKFEDDDSRFKYLDVLNDYFKNKLKIDCQLDCYVEEASSRWEDIEIDEDYYNFVIGWRVNVNFTSASELLKWEQSLPLDHIKIAMSSFFDNNDYQIRYIMGVIA